METMAAPYAPSDVPSTPRMTIDTPRDANLSAGGDSNDGEIAPTFEAARKTLHAILSQWTFSTMETQCTVPKDCVDVSPEGELVITHFFGTAVETPPTVAPSRRRGRGRRVWFKQAARKTSAVAVGPAELLPQSKSRVPVPGDVIVGHTQANDRGRGGLRYAWWNGAAKPLWHLARLVQCGTEVDEEDLRDMLTAWDGREDMWAVARLVLFGNVQCFAEMHNDPHGATRPPRMSLGCPAANFVKQCAAHFMDGTIWVEFLKLAPSAATPREPPPRALPPVPTWEEAHSQRQPDYPVHQQPDYQGHQQVFSHSARQQPNYDQRTYFGGGYPGQQKQQVYQASQESWYSAPPPPPQGPPPPPPPPPPPQVEAGSAYDDPSGVEAYDPMAPSVHKAPTPTSTAAPRSTAASPFPWVPITPPGTPPGTPPSPDKVQSLDPAAMQSLLALQTMLGGASLGDAQ